MSDFRKPRADNPILPRQAIYRTEDAKGFKRPKGRRGRKPKGKKLVSQAEKARRLGKQFKKVHTESARNKARDEEEYKRVQAVRDREVARKDKDQRLQIEDRRYAAGVITAAQSRRAEQGFRQATLALQRLQLQQPQPRQPDINIAPAAITIYPPPASAGGAQRSTRSAGIQEYRGSAAEEQEARDRVYQGVMGGAREQARQQTAFRDEVRADARRAAAEAVGEAAQRFQQEGERLQRAESGISGTISGATIQEIQELGSVREREKQASQRELEREKELRRAEVEAIQSQREAEARALSEDLRRSQEEAQATWGWARDLETHNAELSKSRDSTARESAVRRESLLQAGAKAEAQEEIIDRFTDQYAERVNQRATDAQKQDPAFQARWADFVKEVRASGTYPVRLGDIPEGEEVFYPHGREGSSRKKETPRPEGDPRQRIPTTPRPTFKPPQQSSPRPVSPSARASRSSRTIEPTAEQGEGALRDPSMKADRTPEELEARRDYPARTGKSGELVKGLVNLPDTDISGKVAEEVGKIREKRKEEYYWWEPQTVRHKYHEDRDFEEQSVEDAYGNTRQKVSIDRSNFLYDLYKDDEDFDAFVRDATFWTGGTTSGVVGDLYGADETHGGYEGYGSDIDDAEAQDLGFDDKEGALDRLRFNQGVIDKYEDGQEDEDTLTEKELRVGFREMIRDGIITSHKQVDSDSDEETFKMEIEAEDYHEARPQPNWKTGYGRGFDAPSSFYGKRDKYKEEISEDLEDRRFTQEAQEELKKGGQSSRQLRRRARGGQSAIAGAEGLTSSSEDDPEPEESSSSESSRGSSGRDSPPRTRATQSRPPPSPESSVEVERSLEVEESLEVEPQSEAAPPQKKKKERLIQDEELGEGNWKDITEQTPEISSVTEAIIQKKKFGTVKRKEKEGQTRSYVRGRSDKDFGWSAGVIDERKEGGSDEAGRQLYKGVLSDNKKSTNRQGSISGFKKDLDQEDRDQIPHSLTILEDLGDRELVGKLSKATPKKAGTYKLRRHGVKGATSSNLSRFNFYHDESTGEHQGKEDFQLDLHNEDTANRVEGLVKSGKIKFTTREEPQARADAEGAEAGAAQSGVGEGIGRAAVSVSAVAGNVAEGLPSPRQAAKAVIGGGISAVKAVGRTASRAITGEQVGQQTGGTLLPIGGAERSFSTETPSLRLELTPRAQAEQSEEGLRGPYKAESGGLGGQIGGAE